MSRAAWASVLGAAMVGTAKAFDSASLYVPGVALIALAAGSVVWVGLAGMSVTLRRLPGPGTVQEDEPYPIRFELRPGLLPSPAGELCDPLLPRAISLGARAPRALEIDVQFSRRGRRRFEPGVLYLHDPLGLATRRVPVQGEHEDVLVLPRVEPVLTGGATGTSAAGPGLGGGEGRAGLRGRTDGSAAELDLDGLRPYRLGTPASRIHWPAFARSGEMLERRLTSDAETAPLVVLDAARPPSEGALDQAVRAAASLCLHLARRGGCALLLPGDRRPVAVGADLAAWPSLHARLALVEASQRPPAIACARRAGAVLWVSAAGSSPRDLVRGAGGGGWLVAPHPEPDARADFSVAGCAGYRLGRSARSSVPEAGTAA